MSVPSIPRFPFESARSELTFSLDVLGRPIEKDDLPNLIKFLEDQENRGRWFSKAMNKDS